jgi:hypothetical protein
MSLKRKGTGFILLMLIVGALVGSAFGDLLGSLLPGGVVRNFFTYALQPGINPPLTINLLWITLTMGVTLKLNIIAVLGVVLMGYVLKWLS